MGTERHVADAESGFLVLNVTPDFCKVGMAIVPFDISQTLVPELAGYSKNVFARGKNILLLDSIISGVKGNAGVGISSNVALAAGSSKIVDGSKTVFVEGRQSARDGDLVDMNGMAG